MNNVQFIRKRVDFIVTRINNPCIITTPKNLTPEWKDNFRREVSTQNYTEVQFRIDRSMDKNCYSISYFGNGIMISKVYRENKIRLKYLED